MPGRPAGSLLEYGDHGAVVGLINEILDLLALEGLHQGLDGGLVLPALLDGEHIGVGGARLAVGSLNGQGVGHLQPGVDGVVAVDDGHIHVRQTHRQLAGLQLHDVQVLGVLGDIRLGGGKAGALLEGDQPLLLQQEGLITLKEGAGLTATKADIAENPKNLDIVELEASQLPVRLADVDMAVINGNYAIDAGLKVSDALAVEAADGEAGTAYANVLTVKEGRENEPAIQALVEALQSQQVKDFIDETYDGAVVAVF